MDKIDEILKATEGHTPGPWEYYDDPECTTCVRAPDTLPIGDDEEYFGSGYFDVVNETCGIPSNQDLALILAAPVLRAAVIERTALLAERDAEIIRLRERDAAWEWLARWATETTKFKSVGMFVNDDGNAETMAVVLDEPPAGTPFDDMTWRNVQIAVSDKSDAPDPVALCDKLSRDWRKSNG
jgi:hypothetical protein